MLQEYLNNFISVMTNVIEKTIEIQVNSKIEALPDDMNNLKRQNQDIRQSIEQL